MCVVDDGDIAEFDAPDVLHGQNGIFRTMCEHSGITLEDILRARKERAVRDELDILYSIEQDLEAPVTPLLLDTLTKKLRHSRADSLAKLAL